MSKMDSNFQKVFMSWMYRGKAIFKPLNTGWIDGHVACVREWVANIFFYTKNGTTVMIDAGYNYERLGEKMGWLGIDPASIRHILITHQDTDHVGAVETDSAGLFKGATSNYVYHNIVGHDKQQLLLETLRVLKKGGTFAIHDLMEPARYGDMQAFVRKLKAQGYEDVQLIRTTDGSFMGKIEGTLLGLGGSTLLVGRK